MARFEELMTPSELVATIREGAVKDELVKKYKVSEQELAMMLLPLYRRGEFSKEEFNNFFRGITLKRDTETSPTNFSEDGSTRANVYEPPSEIVRSLSNETPSSEDGEPAASDVEAPDETSVPKAAPESVESFVESEEILQVILAGVTSIDARLAEIEKKINSR